MNNAAQEEIDNQVDKWVWALIDSLALASTSAFAAGMFHAGGKLKSGISWTTAKDNAISYMENYRKNLAERGIITVSTPVYNDGLIVDWKQEEVKWLTDTAAQMKSDVKGIIEDGMRSGTPAGVSIGKDGLYKEGGIARMLQDYTEKLKNRVKTISTTEIHRAYTNGMKELYSSEGVQYVRWVCQPDACDICIPMNNQIFQAGTQPDSIHPNCLCECEPYQPSLSELIR